MDNITERMIAQANGREVQAKDALILYQMTSTDRAAKIQQNGMIYEGCIIAVALIISAILKRSCVCRSCRAPLVLEANGPHEMRQV